MSPKNKIASPPKTSPKREKLIPEIVIAGEGKRTKDIGRLFDQMNVIVEVIEWPFQLEETIKPQTHALVLSLPIKNNLLFKAIETIRKRVQLIKLPIVPIVPNNTADQTVLRLYRADASAVFKWPSESKNLPYILAEILGMSYVWGKPNTVDNALARTIRAHLKTAVLSSSSLTVEVSNGVVSISGRVPTLKQKQHVGDLVERIPGVRHCLVDDLFVSHSGIPDREIRKSVKHVLKATTDIDQSTLVAKVQNGYITLAGSASDKDEYTRIVTVLSHINGVRGIKNYTVVSDIQKQNDRTLRNRLIRLLTVYFPKNRIDLKVFGTTVVLSGHAKNVLRKKEIRDLVELQEGVGRVINKIAVTT